MKLTIEIESGDLDLIDLAKALEKATGKKLRLAGASPVPSDDLRLTVGKLREPSQTHVPLNASRLHGECQTHSSGSQKIHGYSESTDDGTPVV